MGLSPNRVIWLCFSSSRPPHRAAASQNPAGSRTVRAARWAASSRRPSWQVRLFTPRSPPRSTQFRQRSSPSPERSSTPVGPHSLDRAICTFLDSIRAATLKPRRARRLARICGDFGKDRPGGQTMPMRVGTELRRARGAWRRGFCICWVRLISIHEQCPPVTSSSCRRRRKRRSWQTRENCLRHAGPSTRRS